LSQTDRAAPFDEPADDILDSENIDTADIGTHFIDADFSARKRKSPDLEDLPLDTSFKLVPEEVLSVSSESVTPSFSHLPQSSLTSAHSPVASTTTSFFDRQLARANRPSASRNFADLFRQPDDILFHGSLESAKQKARTSNLWLLLDLHDPSQFVCQCLNRDLWSDITVKEFIKANFLFLQFSIRSHHGQNYLSLYPVPHSHDSNASANDYQMPHIAILDPRTGERMKVWQKSLSALDFLQEMSDFIDVNCLSLPSPTSRNPQDPIQRPSAVLRDTSPLQDATTTKIPPKSDFKAENIPEPPVSTPNVTRIQFRLPDGKRHVRRYFKYTLVQQLYSSLLFDFPTLNNFDLFFQSTDLKPQANITLDEAGLLNAAISVKALQ